MTCIIGCELDGEVYMGGDSGAVDDYATTAMTEEKVYQIHCQENKSQFLIGYEGSFRMGQVVRYQFHPPEHFKEISDMKYLTTKFIDELIECLETNRVLTKDLEERIETDRMLLGYKGKLYTIDSDFNILRNRLGFDTIGSGFELARGAMLTYDKLNKGIKTKKNHMSPEDRIINSLETVGEMCSSVCAPYYVKKLLPPS